MQNVYSCAKLDVPTAASVIHGICVACKETAEIRGIIRDGVYEVSGTAVGAIRHGDRMLPRKEDMRAGDLLVGLASSGCHSNGFALIRKIVEEEGLQYSDPTPWEDDMGRSVGDALLEPTRIYSNSVLGVVEKGLVKGTSNLDRYEWLHTDIVLTRRCARHGRWSAREHPSNAQQNPHFEA